jgi:unsaturated rhamnogalacturonyl hydrolase
MKRILTLSLILCALVTGSFAQKNIGLDNWFNHETNAKTGKIFHYTWDDQENSGFSQLGDLFLKREAKLNTIATAPNSQSMKGIDIYIIVDPDTTKENPTPNYVQANDIKFLKKWVSKGGVLLLMANDGPNCEFTHLNQLGAAFGFQFHPQTLNPVINRQWDQASEINLPNHPLFSGVKKIYMKEVGPITVSKDAKPVLKDGESNAIFIAETKFGKGYVLAVGDPWLYNEYIDHAMLPESFENLKAANNLVDLLLKKAEK